MALTGPKPLHLSPEGRKRRIPDPGLKPRLDERGYPYYRYSQKARDEEQPNRVGLEYLTVRGVWAPERRTLARLIAEGLIDHRDERLLRMLEGRGIHLPADFASSVKGDVEALREIGGGVCARVLNVLGGHLKNDQGVVSRSGWHPLGFIIKDRRPNVSFIEAGQETPLELDQDFLASIEVDGIHRAVAAKLRTTGIVLNGVPYGLRVAARTD